MHSHIMLLVRDVEHSSDWYCRLLNAQRGRGGARFDRIVSNGQILLMLHHMDAEGHPAIADPTRGTPGRGVLIYLFVDNLQQAYRRAQELGADLVDTPHFNPNARQSEFSLYDPDGYALTLASREDPEDNLKP